MHRFKENKKKHLPYNQYLIFCNQLQNANLCTETNYLKNSLKVEKIKKSIGSWGISSQDKEINCIMYGKDQQKKNILKTIFKTEGLRFNSKF